MSDDSKDKPSKKLKLSRDLKTQPAAEEAPKPPAAEAEKAAKPPVMKLRRREELETATTPDASPTDSPAPAAVPSTTSPEPGTKDQPPVDETPQAGKPAYDPENPFADIIKEGEIKKPVSPAPELPSKPAPHPDDGSGAKVEEAIGTLNESTQRTNSFLPSVLVLLVLVLVLVGAGYGLWKVLQTPDDDAPPATSGKAELSSQAAAPEPRGPIQKAKAVIDQLPGTDVDLITGKTDGTAPSTTGGLQTETAATTVEQATETLTPQVSSPVVTKANSKEIEANKQKVSQYLATIHIGGVRKSDRPMILVDGQSYLVGDLVHGETGLKFDGIRKDRLAFRDSHGIVYLKSF